ncbi:hypothetical protein DIPPA_01588 [Diplonema papillatum]|nr:hypothetical protein DIPPA_01588 [Diplonema papillatum]
MASLTTYIIVGVLVLMLLAIGFVLMYIYSFSRKFDPGKPQDESAMQRRLLAQEGLSRHQRVMTEKALESQLVEMDELAKEMREEQTRIVNEFDNKVNDLVVECGFDRDVAVMLVNATSEQEKNLRIRIRQLEKIVTDKEAEAKDRRKENQVKDRAEQKKMWREGAGAERGLISFAVAEMPEDVMHYNEMRSAESTRMKDLREQFENLQQQLQQTELARIDAEHRFLYESDQLADSRSDSDDEPNNTHITLDLFNRAPHTSPQHKHKPHQTLQAASTAAATPSHKPAASHASHEQLQVGLGRGKAHEANQKEKMKRASPLPNGHTIQKPGPHIITSPTTVNPNHPDVAAFIGGDAELKQQQNGARVMNSLPRSKEPADHQSLSLALKVQVEGAAPSPPSRRGRRSSNVPI